MASVSAPRTSMFNETFLNENEQDANTVLTELDKGLRSTKIGIQCEAIVRFPRLFEKYPFPILINSSFLKLAEFFLNGSNLLRFWVLRVCQQSENHLDKILNIDAFVKRIFTVTHSNDPVARALTLRTLGAVSRVIPEKQQVHHAIRRALDSNDNVEVEAAIYASSQFAAQSRTFAISMCSKISDMIESLQIPVPMKLLLIPVLRHMHHDANTAALVSKLCLNLLPQYPAESFVVAILDTLTQLSARTLTGVPEQLKLLLDFLEDFRAPVRIAALRSFNRLAENQCVHAWPKEIIGKLIAQSNLCEEPSEQFLFLSIILKLSDCPLTCYHMLVEHNEAMRKLCTECVCMCDYATASQAMAVIAALIKFGAEKHPQQIERLTVLVDLHMEGLLICTVREASHLRNLRRLLTSGIRIASVDAKFGADFAKMITDLLSDDEVDYPVANAEKMCEALVALCSHFQMIQYAVPERSDENAMETDEPMPTVKINPMVERLPLILHKFSTLVDSAPKPEQLHTVEILATVILQTLMGSFLPRKVIDCFEKCFEHINCWTLYRIARTASRYGHHFVAAHIYTTIAPTIIIDKMHFYMLSMAQLSCAECILNYGVEYEYMHDNYELCVPEASDSSSSGTETPQKAEILPLMERLESATSLYWQALASLRASSSSSHPFNFQLEYLKLRAQFLQILHMAVTVKNAQVIVPPPAIAGSLAQNARDYLLKFGHVTIQLRKLVKSLRVCEESFSRLYKSAFDADHVTLEFLEVSEFQCALFAHIVEKICYTLPSDPPVFLATGHHPETRYFASCCHRMELMQKHLPQEPKNAKTINNRHLDVIIAEIEIITKTPLVLPRYFFQTLQSTQIKLSVSPQPRNPTEPVIVQSGSNLVIKVEGVIQHYGKQQARFRRVESVQLSLTSQLMTPRPVNEVKSMTNDTVTLNQTVKPQRDFLSGSFLLPISSGGQWQVALETFVIDENGISWCTGPKSSMLVRVLDDPAKPTTSAASASQSVGQTRRF